MRMAFSLGLGFIVGLMALTTMLTRAPAYLLDDPQECVNCHVMRPEYASWAVSSHREQATCNDCHVPHDIPRKYVFKALDGVRHAALFTLGQVPEPIVIRDESKATVQENCRRCHAAQVDDTRMGGGHYCFECHRATPHGNPSAGAPRSRVPEHW